LSNLIKYIYKINGDGGEEKKEEEEKKEKKKDENKVTIKRNDIVAKQLRVMLD